MSCLLSLDPVYGYCKAREISDIVASGTWLLQDTGSLRHCCIWYMAAARYEMSPTSLRLTHGCCKIREVSDIVASGTWLLQVTNILRVGSFDLHMAVAGLLNAMREVIDGFGSDRFLISCRFVRGNMVSQNVR